MFSLAILKGRMDQKPKVLFLCTGNSARSQMAEAFLRRFGGDHFDAYSAGLEPKGLNPLTVQVMEEIGISMDGHASKGVNIYLGKTLFQYLITVCDQAEKNCPTIWPGISHKLHWSFEDPAAVEGSEDEKLAKFRVVRDQIQQQIQSWIAQQE
jgi:arsenate reductase (thioredoxin)